MISQIFYRSRHLAACSLTLALLLPSLCMAQASTLRTIPYVTRAEAALILLTSLGTPVSDRRNEGQYPDLIEGEWYVRYVLEAIDRKILDKPSQGLAHPHRPVTRAEYLKMLTRTFGIQTGLPHQYEDVAREDWYWPYAGVAKRYQLFTKPAIEKLHPNVLITHMEASQSVQNILNAHPALRKTPAASLEGISVLERTPAFLPQLQQQIPQIVHPAASGNYITASMVKYALMQALQSSLFIGTRTKTELLTQINAERARHGIAPLALNPILTQAAELHAADMWKRRYFSHITPEGRTYVDRMRAAGYFTPPASCSCEARCTCEPYFSLGENIAQGQLTVEQVMSDWLNSPPHRENMLNPNFTDIGIGLFGTIWVETFGHIEFRQKYY
ncbi:MAG: CAP domain-containing protein [Candidatus Peribacteraceae bacterium]|nr:CAP domain-containing protein [Candidatus Peribacteraceae bacterium]